MRNPPACPLSPKDLSLFPRYMSHVRHGAFTYVTYHMLMCDITHIYRHDSYMCDMTYIPTYISVTHSPVWQHYYMWDICVTPLIYVWSDLYTYLHIRSTFTCVASLLHVIITICEHHYSMWDMTYIPTYIYVTYSHVWHHSYVCDMTYIPIRAFTCITWPLPCHTYMSHVTRHGTRASDGYTAYKPYSHVSDDCCTARTMCDTAHSHMWRNIFTCVISFISVWHDLYIESLFHVNLVAVVMSHIYE